VAAVMIQSRPASMKADQDLFSVGDQLLTILGSYPRNW
jgi:hypothetical protein